MRELIMTCLAAFVVELAAPVTGAAQTPDEARPAPQPGFVTEELERAQRAQRRDDKRVDDIVRDAVTKSVHQLPGEAVIKKAPEAPLPPPAR